VDRHSYALRGQYREILRFVRRRTDTSVDAEDVTQEVFADAAHALQRSADAAAPTLAWLYTVARRRLIDKARRTRLETVPLELAPDPVASNFEYSSLVASTLYAALSTLPEAQRSVVILRLLEGWSFGEISAYLAVTEDACRMRFMRGLEQLRVEFERGGLTP